MQGSPRTSRPTGLLWGLAAAAALLLLALVVEGAALLFFAATRGAFFYTTPLAIDEAEEAAAAAGSTALHPYYGYSIRPGTRVLRFDDPARGQAFLRGAPDPTRPPEWVHRRSNNFGFYGEDDYPVLDPEAYLVGIFGGSFAHSLALQSGERLAARLAADSRLDGRPVRVLNFASGGYKQPQQLMILAYFLSIGQRLDYVVNVDGFNEAVFGRGNIRRGVDSSMPGVQFLRALGARASGPRDPETLRYLLAVEDLRARRAALGEARARAWLASQYLWADLRLRRVSAQHQGLAAEPPAPQPGASLLWLPAVLEDGETAEPDEKIAAEWFRASTLMAALAAGAGARYLHLLQPNQYASGRRFQEEERRIALDPASPYGPVAQALYPVLRRWGGRLAAAGVDYADATGLFDAEPQIVYADDCCHLNQRGTDLFADLVAERMAARLRAEAGARTPDDRPGD